MKIVKKEFCVLCKNELAGFAANGMCIHCFASKYGGTTFEDENGNVGIKGCVVTDKCVLYLL